MAEKAKNVDLMLKKNFEKTLYRWNDYDLIISQLGVSCRYNSLVSEDGKIIRGEKHVKS